MKDRLMEELDVEFNKCMIALFERKKSLLNQIELKIEAEGTAINTPLHTRN